jgi:hypothetical protein
VESLADTFDGFEVRVRSSALSFVNKYNAWSILNELRWALEPEATFPPEALQQLATGDWLDPHVHAIFGAVERDVAIDLHRRLTQLTSRIAECRVVVLTLGLVETFFDTWTGLFTNETPDLGVEPDRFRFRVLSYDEVVQALEEIHRLLQRHGHPDLQIVVTVSRVALEATFTGEDVVLANTLSKSVLRAAASWWAGACENVHYFPSYEMVMNTRPEIARRIDGSHVPDEMVQEIMRAFFEAHLDGDEVALAASPGVG